MLVLMLGLLQFAKADETVDLKFIENLGKTKKTANKVLTRKAGNELRPLRPTHFPKDTALSAGPVENFERLYIDPGKVGTTLKPSSSTAKSTGSTLPIVNTTIGWVDILVEDNKIGRLGPLTTGMIHNLKAGNYKVTFQVEHTQYEYDQIVATFKQKKPVTPGNKRAKIAMVDGFAKPGFDDRPAPAKNLMTHYQRPIKQKVKVEGKRIVITEKIFFDFGKSTIQEKSNGLLNQLSSLLLKNPQIKKVKVVGHTDSVGSARANLKLSQQRATAVVQALVKRKVEASRLTAIGKGSKQPLVVEKTDADRNKNRRVEFLIVN